MTGDAIYRKGDPELTVTEWCGNCGEEVSVPAFSKGVCPNCKAPMLPCSTCASDGVPIPDCGEINCWYRTHPQGNFFAIDPSWFAHVTAKQIQKAIATVSEGQNAGQLFPCPLCGRRMDPRIEMNALSRYADIHICSNCGKLEASGKIPFRQWAVMGMFVKG